MGGSAGILRDPFHELARTTTSPSALSKGGGHRGGIGKGVFSIRENHLAVENSVLKDLTPEREYARRGGRRDA